MKASDIQLDQNNSFLFKSSPGFGKTLAAASMALYGPLYLSYWDKNKAVELVTFFTKERFGSKAKIILDNIEVDYFNSENANEYLNKLIEFKTKRCPYDTIVNDSITYMTSAAVNWSMNFGKDVKMKRKIKDILPDWDEYKVETSLVSQCIDLSRSLPCNVIWTAHPMPTTRIEGSGGSIKVTKTNSLVSYGTKVAAMIPGSFTEIYHFSQSQNWAADGKSDKKYIVNVEAIGDEFAKSPLLSGHVKEFDITDRLFSEVWRELMDQKFAASKANEGTKAEGEGIVNPFENANQSKWKI